MRVSVCMSRKRLNGIYLPIVFTTVSQAYGKHLLQYRIFVRLVVLISAKIL